MSVFTDYYSVLGVSANASSDEIKAAFKKLALQYHPDVYKGEDAQERMRVLLLAYKTLNDPTSRQQYDARRSEHVEGVKAPRFSYEETVGRTTTREQMGARPPASAKRDRARHYAFPDFLPGQPVVINLVDITYTLPPAEARLLVQHSMLRGIAPYATNDSYYCHRCHHRWQSNTTKSHDNNAEIPQYCPKCLATDWPEYLLLRCIHCCAVFESEQIRYEIGSYSYGNKDATNRAGLCPPYELFPLCPYCGTARWSPAEDARVSELRVRVERRSARTRVLILTIAVIMLVVASVVVVGMLR